MSWPSLVLCKKVRTQRQVLQAGFGLVELMVSIGIMLIVMSIVLVNQTSFNGAVLLRGEAYKVALSTREIQLSAVSAMGDGGGNFRSVLGVHFDTANDSIYKIFKDAGNNHFYTLSTEEFGTQGKIDPRFEIDAIKELDDTAISGGKVSVVFERPNFDARFFTGAGNELITSGIKIDVRRRGSTGSGDGDVRTIEITASGQISVQ